jgi:transcriptional regulator with XRE-family HTH domain
VTVLRHILALNIKERRRFLGLSQERLAEKVNTAPTYIAMIELEKRSPSLEMLERIAEALNIDPPDLFTKTTCQVERIKMFHESVLGDFEKALNNRIDEFMENPNVNVDVSP